MESKESEVRILDTTLKVNSIEEKNRNGNIYYRTPEFDSRAIYGYGVYEGILEQTGGVEAILKLIFG